MTENGNPRGKHVAGAFVFMLLGVFALFAAFMVLMSAQFYRGIVDDAEAHGNSRVLTNYIINTVRGNDSADSVFVDNVNGTDVLVFVWSAEDSGYQTMVYCYEGSLREYFCARNEVPELSYGEIICPAQSFDVSLEGNLLSIEAADADGEKRLMHIALRCGQGVAE